MSELHPLKDIRTAYSITSFLGMLIFLFLLVIEVTAKQNPPWQWATTTGDSSTMATRGTCIATDPQSGFIVIAGTFNDAKVAGAGSIGSEKVFFGNTLLQYDVVEPEKSRNGFLVKYDSLGNVLWGRKLASMLMPVADTLGEIDGTAATGIIPTDIVIDRKGSIYVSGNIIAGRVMFDIIGFDINIFLPSGFVVKYVKEGNVVWAEVQMGGRQAKRINHIALGGDGNNALFVTGWMQANSTFTLGGTSISSTEHVTMVAQMDAGTGRVIWSQLLAPSGNMGYFGGITADQSGCYVTGSFDETFIFGRDTLNYDLARPNDLSNYGQGFLLKMNAATGAPEWGRVIGCRKMGGVVPVDIALDKYGHVAVAGNFYAGNLSGKGLADLLPDTLFFSDTVFIVFPAYVKGYESDARIRTGFMAKYNTEGNALWVRAAARNGGTGNKYQWVELSIEALTVEDKGYWYVLGNVHRGSLGGIYFPPTTAYSTYSTLHLTKFDPEGYVTHTYGLTAEPEDAAQMVGNPVWPRDISMDQHGNAYITGSYHYGNVVFGPDTFFRKHKINGEEFFIAKLGLCTTAAVSGSVFVNSCDSYTAPSGRHTWYNSGNYQDKISTSSGCDSLLTIQLHINRSRHLTQQVSACNSYTSPSGRYIWSASGTYSDTLTTAMGCDSIINTELRVFSAAPDTAVAATPTALTALADGDSYQWIDCGNNFTPMPGATEKSFTPLQAGSYAVIITKGCVDTSSCYKIEGTTSLDSLNGWGNKIQLYPNPTQGLLHLDMAVPGRKDIEIVNSMGQTVGAATTVQHQFSLDLGSYADGLYFVYIWMEEGTVVRKVVLVR